MAGMSRRAILALVLGLLALLGATDAAKPSVNKDDLSLESVIMLSRHGNRSPNAIVNSLFCAKARDGVNKLYASQSVAAGSLTHTGLHGMWNLGQYTYENYVKSGFLPSTYTKMHSQVFAAAGYRTLISASAWGQVAYPESYANGPHIPVPVFSVPEEGDNLLEVRKATCAARLSVDLSRFDHTTAVEMIHEHGPVIDKISKACGFDLRHAPAVTNGEFSVMQAVKDVADALTGDMLEGFPLIDGITVEDRAEFLQLAEDIFHARHYGAAPAMSAYLTGDFPIRMLKLFDRRIAYNANVTAVEHYPSSALAQEVVKATEEALEPVKAPRRMYAYHAHRELLYALSKLLKLDVTVDRPGVQKGLIHPSTGMFFELWRDSKKADELEGRAIKNGENPVLNSERGRRRRYDSSPVDESYFVRAMVWVPCWDEKGATVLFKGKDETPLCPARVRVLEQCGQEFCPLPQFRNIIKDNFRAVGGDFKEVCSEDIVAELQDELATIISQKTAAGTKSEGKSGVKGEKGSVVHGKRARAHGKNSDKNDKYGRRGKRGNSHKRGKNALSGAVQYMQYVEDDNNWARVAAGHGMN